MFSMQKVEKKFEDTKRDNQKPYIDEQTLQRSREKAVIPNVMALYQVRVITVFTVFRLLTDFVCLYNYEFWLSLCKIVRSSVILSLPLINVRWVMQLHFSLPPVFSGVRFTPSLVLCVCFADHC